MQVAKKRCLSRKSALDWKVCFMQVAKNDVSVENQA